MKKIYIDRSLSLFAVALWMAVIFLFSAQSGDNSGDFSGNMIRFIARIFNPSFEKLTNAEQNAIIDSLQTLVRKLGHFSEYFILGLLSANAVRTFPLSALWKWLAPLIFCILYAVSDEVHQYFVPDRAMRFLDCCIDSSGAFCGIFAFIMLSSLFTRIAERKKHLS